MKLKKISLYIFFYLVTYFLLFPTKIVYADILPENPWTSACNANEIEVQCQNVSADYSSPPYKWGCELYEKNSDYRELTYRKSFDDNSNIIIDKKYCISINQDKSLELYKYYLVKILKLLVITLLLELPILALFKIIKTFRELKIIVLINFVSITMLSLLQWFLPLNHLFVQIAGEGLVVVTEILLTMFFLPYISRKTIITGLIICNLISATIGTVVFYLI